MAATLPPIPESETSIATSVPISGDVARMGPEGAPRATPEQPSYMRLGEILMERGKIEAEDLERASSCSGNAAISWARFWSTWA